MRPTLEFHWRHGEATLVLRGWVHPQHFLNRMRDGRLVSLDERPLVGMLVKEHDAAADQLGDRLAARAGNKDGERGYILVTEVLLAALVIDQRRLGQLGNEQPVGLPPLKAGQIQHVSGHVERGLYPLLGRIWVALFAVQEGVNPQAHLLALPRRDSENRRDDLDGEERRELGHEIELLASGELVEVAVDHLRDERFETADGISAERLAHQLALKGVLGRIHHDHHVGDHRPLLEQQLERDAVRAHKANRITVCGDYVRVTRERKEAVLLVEVDRGLLSEAGVGLVGIVEESVRERIEFDSVVRHRPPRETEAVTGHREYRSLDFF